MHVENGLWVFGGDGDGNHNLALKVLEAWHDGVDLKSAFTIPGRRGRYDLYTRLTPFMAIVYGMTGNSALHFMFVNAWLGTLSGLLAYLIASKLESPKAAALTAGTLVAFWPSSLIWSSQLLKDSLVLALLLLLLYLVLSIWRQSRDGFSGSGWLVRSLRWSALLPVSCVLAYVRAQTAAILAASALVFVVAFGRALLQRRWREAGAAVALICLLFGGVVSGVYLDPFQLASNPNPEIGYVNRGDRLRNSQQLPSAIEAYRKAIEFNPNYPPAYAGWALALQEQRKLNDADAMLDEYLRLEHDNGRRELFRTTMEKAGLLHSSSGSVAANRNGTAPSGQRAANQVPATSITSPVKLPPVLGPNPGAASAADTVRQTPTVETPSAAAPNRPAAIPKSAQRNAAAAQSNVTQTLYNLWSKAVSALKLPVTLLRQGFAQLPDKINGVRRGWVGTGGGTVIDPDVHFRSFMDIVAYSPRAFGIAFMSPYPASLFSSGGQTGIFRLLAIPELILTVLLLPSFFIHACRGLAQFRCEEWFLVTFVGALAVGYGLVVPNGGTLFREKLQYLFPSLILASAALPKFAYRLFDLIPVVRQPMESVERPTFNS
jgi:tetratricopeptide (TPR) repeat protein